MKIWILSDLHLRAPFRPPIPNADVCVVAGDVCEGIGHALHWLSSTVGHRMPVVFVPGNHEFYGSSVAEELLGARRDIAAGLYPGVHLLDDEAIDLDGVRFIGSTLWTDYALTAGGKDKADAEREIAHAMAAGEGLLVDHRTISVLVGDKRRRWLASDAREAHAWSRAFLEEALDVPFDGATVVVTHHAPHPGSISSRFVGSALNPSFISDLTETIARGRPDLWVHGHVHSSHDYVVGATRIVANPRGYIIHGELENRAFKPGLVIEVTPRSAPLASPDPAWLREHANEIAEVVGDRHGDVAFEVVARAPMLWQGWEFDTAAVLVELADGRRDLLALEGAMRPITRADLVERLAEYRKAAAATEDFLRLLDEAPVGEETR